MLFGSVSAEAQRRKLLFIKKSDLARSIYNLKTFREFTLPPSVALVLWDGIAEHC
jgi:hypothetical protein